MDNGLANFIEDEMKLKIPSKIKPPLANTKCVLNVRTTSVEEIFRENTMPNLPKIQKMGFFIFCKTVYFRYFILVFGRKLLSDFNFPSFL